MFAVGNVPLGLLLTDLLQMGIRLQDRRVAGASREDEEEYWNQSTGHRVFPLSLSIQMRVTLFNCGARPGSAKARLTILDVARLAKVRIRVVSRAAGGLSRERGPAGDAPLPRDHTTEIMGGVVAYVNLRRGRPCHLSSALPCITQRTSDLPGVRSPRLDNR